MKTTSKPSATAELAPDPPNDPPNGLPAEKTGILLINLGTPDATDYWSVRRYLRQFLSDRRVVEASGVLWWLVFNGIILTRRPQRSARAYRQIWNHQRDESPLRSFTRAQSEKLAKSLSGHPGVVVDWAMRYGTPPIAPAITRLIAQGCSRILFFPLYPQYSSATTGTAMDVVFDTMKTLRSQPAIRSVAPYFAHPEYISALVRSIRAHHAALGWQPQVIIASLHGLPVDFIAKGDPYQSHCEASIALLREALGLDERQLLLTYQSRSGRKQWLGPDTAETVARLARDGVQNLSLIAPGFAADGVETLEELGLRAVQGFTDAGGRNITLIPCLNDSDISVAMLKKLALENLSGWP